MEILSQEKAEKGRGTEKMKMSKQRQKDLVYGKKQSMTEAGETEGEIK